MSAFTVQTLQWAVLLAADTTNIKIHENVLLTEWPGHVYLCNRTE